MTPAQHRIAGAPISWGVCEVPNWGYQLTPERVLAEMQDVGLSATELGPDGFLPADPGQMAKVLDTHHLTAVGGFTPVLMHQAGHDPLPGDRPDPRRLRRHRRQNPGAVGGLRAGRIRQPPGTGRRRLGAAAAQPGPHLRPSRRTRRGRRAAPARRDHGRDRRRCPAGPRGLGDVAVPGHRAPADRRHRPGRTHPSGPRTGSPTPTSRTSTTPSRPRSGPAA